MSDLWWMMLFNQVAAIVGGRGWPPDLSSKQVGSQMAGLETYLTSRDEL
jgi:hypothetical protein